MTSQCFTVIPARIDRFIGTSIFTGKLFWGIALNKDSLDKKSKNLEKTLFVWEKALKIERNFCSETGKFSESQIVASVDFT